MPDNSGFTIEAFTDHAKRITQSFEKRRTHFLHKLKFRAVVACVLLFTFPFWYSLLTRWDHLDGGFSTVGLLIVHVLAAIIIIIVIVAYAVHPLFRYRYDTFRLGASMPGATGVVNQSVTLKEQIFTELLKYFGDFRMYSDRKMSLKSFRQAPNIPEFDDFECSDYFKGQITGVTVECAEIKLISQKDSSHVRIFSGIMVVLDINDSNLVLRGKFAGKTIVMQKAQNENAFIVDKYDGYQRVKLTDDSFAQHFDVYSTHVDEAKHLASNTLMRILLRLNDTITNTRISQRAVDDRMAAALERIISGLGDVMAAFAESSINWLKTGRFAVKSTRHKFTSLPADVDIDATFFAKTVQCAFYNDKILLSIPTPKNLFEPDSVFNKPLGQNDVLLVYSLMNEIHGLTGAVLKELPKEMY